MNNSDKLKPNQLDDQDKARAQDHLADPAIATTTLVSLRTRINYLTLMRRSVRLT